MTTMFVKKTIVKQVEIPNLGQRIKDARVNSPKSLEQLCRDVGFSRTYWYDIENGFLKGGLSVETLRKIESALGVDFGVTFD